MDGFKGWFMVPVKFHSSRAFECGDMTAPQCAWYQHKWHFWYEADHVFALSTTYFCIAAVSLFLLGRILYLFLPQGVVDLGICRCSLSCLRYLCYRCFRFRWLLSWYSPSLGVLLLGAVGCTFFFSMMLRPQPYYWPTFAFGQPADYGSSPPLATRSGWMALALFPFVIALPMKLNLISLVTGVSHERLQVFHRWGAFFMLVLGLVHTFPFIVHDIRMGMMEQEWRMDPFNKSGVATLIPQAYLTLCSWGPFRRRFYEIFKFTHILAAALFAVFFFIHCNFTLTSCDYFIAAAAVYFLPYTMSLLRTYLEYGILTEAQLDLAAPGLLCITIPIVQNGMVKVHWQMGQHMFLRFFCADLGLHCITAHPFTVSSHPANDAHTGVLRFYIKPHKGITARLASMASKAPGRRIKVTLDGPYGGMQETQLANFHDIWIIAGGSGASFALPLIEDYARSRQKEMDLIDESDGEGASKEGIKPKAKPPCNVVFASRDLEMISWYTCQISELLARYPRADIDVSVHSTAASPRHTTSDVESKEHGTLESLDGVLPRIKSQSGRPDLPRMLLAAASAPQAAGKDMGIAVCGPESMIFDVRNASAEIQRQIVARNKDVTVAGCYLHTEVFGW